MTINQLFRKKPTPEIVEELLKTFGLFGLNDQKIFSRKDLENIETVSKIECILNKVGDYYLPCKKKLYLNELTSKKAITVLRQFIKTYNHTLFSKEKYYKSEKIIVYQLVPKLVNLKDITKKNNGGCVISFD